MTDLLFFIMCGAGVGFAVGLTGVGGGSLMTPLLIFSGVPTKIAIGTDLLYAAATKSGALLSHHRQQTIKWDVVGLLCAGSIPASLGTSAILKYALPGHIIRCIRNAVLSRRWRVLYGLTSNALPSPTGY